MSRGEEDKRVKERESRGGRGRRKEAEEREEGKEMWERRVIRFPGLLPLKDNTIYMYQ